VIELAKCLAMVRANQPAPKPAQHKPFTGLTDDQAAAVDETAELVKNKDVPDERDS
jgi:hypothetical protein